jgi:transposase
MNYIGIDLAKKNSYLCTKNDEGEIVSETKCKTADLEEFFASIDKSKIAIETCENAWCVARSAKSHGHEILVVASSSVKMLGVGAHRTKNDTRDARALADILRLPSVKSVHVQSVECEAMKDELQTRANFVECRKNLTLTLKAYYRRRLIDLKGTVRSIPKQVTKFHAQYLSDNDDVSEDNIENEFEQEMKQLGEIPPSIRSSIEMLQQLTAHIKLADKRIEAIANKDKVCQRLMTIPGVGVNVSIGFRAAVDDVTRFKNGAQLASYFGLAPGENSTGGKTVRTGITKCGNDNVRRLLVMAAHVHMMQSKPSMVADWARNVALKRGKLKAVVALARKMATIMLSMWKSEEDYNEKKGAEKLGPLNEEQVRKTIWRKVSRK